MGFPIVGVLSDIEAFRPVLNVDEVDAIFNVLLQMFLKIMVMLHTLLLTITR